MAKPMKTEEEITERIEGLLKKRIYLYEFIDSIYNNGLKKESLRELKYIDRELDALQWVINDNELPF